MTDKWEYEVERMNNVSGSLVDILNQRGEEGWEFVLIFPKPPITELVFKRKKAQVE